MPKASKAANPAALRASSSSVGASKSHGNGKASTAVKTYSSFLPIPLSIPTPTPIPSSSSKPLTATTHYLYVRAHRAGPSRSSSANASGSTGTQGLPSDRTAFVANIPVDMGEHALRSVFARWGVVERIEYTGGRGADGLEMAVLGIEPDSDEEDEDEDADEEEEEEADGGADGVAAGAKFIGDTTLPRRQRKRLNKLPSSVPTITPLPPLDPRTSGAGDIGNAFHPSGLRCAHVVYLDAAPLTALLSPSSAHSTIPIPADSTLPTGLPYYLSLHSSLRPSLPAIRAWADSSMARFDHLSSLLLSSRARQQGAGALVDEDGFTVVVRSGKGGRTGGLGDGTRKGTTSIGIASRGFAKKAKAGEAHGKKGKGKGAGELEDFYKFQKTERKRQELAQLRNQWEKDKQKVADMRQAKRFKPY